MKFILYAALISLFSFTAVAQEEVPREITIIHAGTLLPVAGGETLSEQSIIVEDGKITDVVPSYISGDMDADVTIVDLKDKFVMAAMMDVHIHMAEGDLNNPSANAADHALMGVINSRKVLMAGFTTVRDLGARDDTLYKIIEGIDKGDIMGPRIIPGGIIIGVGNRDNGRECNGVESCRKTTRDMITEGAKWIKIRSSCRGGQLCSNEDGAPIFFDDEFKTITDVARKYEIPVAVHSHPRDSALQALKFGITSLEHGTFMNEEAMDIMVRDGVYYVPTMSNLDETERAATNPDTDPIYAEHNMKFVTRHPETVIKAYEKGVKIATGTDGDGRNAGTNYREVEYFVRSGIPNNDALKMATVNSAELLGFSDTLGSVEAGKIADIIAMDGNPLETIEVI
ncbi:MAG: amidohydrolase family protein, partial [Kordiimonadaceae bacterium]|nr:amidohydrolase family protein [Kordiimonadaceae bacterium]